MALERIQVLHTRSVKACADVVAKATVDDLGRPTPCAGWTFADLLAHMTAQDRGFAAAARGAQTTVDDWRPAPAGDRAIEIYLEAAAEVQAAFEEEGVLDREMLLPEFTTKNLIPGKRVIRAHLIDCVVHGWDVARTIGVDYQLDDDLIAEAYAVAESIPDGEHRGKFFARAVATGPETTTLDRIVAHLGRSPSWPH